MTPLTRWNMVITRKRLIALGATELRTTRMVNMDVDLLLIKVKLHFCNRPPRFKPKNVLVKFFGFQLFSPKCVSRRILTQPTLLSRLNELALKSTSTLRAYPTTFPSDAFFTLSRDIGISTKPLNSLHLFSFWVYTLSWQEPGVSV